MFQENVRITKNEKLNTHFFHLAFTSKKISRRVSCGQFIMLKITDGCEPLLRRPLSVGWVDKNSIHLVYKIVGKGTSLLATRKEGETLNVLGPLGKGFTFHPRNDVVLVAGGIGIASLIALTTMCRQGKIKLLYGAKTKSEFIPERFLSLTKKSITYVTEDGSFGTKGLVTNVLEHYLKTNGHKKPYIYTCGPMPMLRAVTKLAHKFKVDGEASLEERMACGVGACLGCAVETVQGVKMVCKDGPVFSFEELGWAPLEIRGQ
ncbi:MAG: dihydroorotate dehydrogenase electron transfer subunit [Candidatus Omnitrophica bacterium]|nr:dihydroorotate dehydrogenase electron transfer subunit [Candidatus Omnitrophota bacterium]